MPMTTHDETDLLSALHEGVLEDRPWATFLTRLRRRAAADHASLLLRRNDAIVEHAAGTRGSTEPWRGPMALFYRSAPMLFHALRPGRVYASAEFLDPDNADHHAYRRDFPAGEEFRHVRLMRIAGPEGSSGWLTLARAKEDFSAATGSLLSALGLHLAIAIRVSEAIERQRTGALVAGTALHRLGIGCMTVDARGRVIDHDDLAGRIVHRHMLLQDIANGSAAEAIAAILRRPDGRSHALRLSSQPRIDILIVPLPSGAASGGAVTAVYVDAEDNHATSTHDARGAALQVLFGLSPKEARLADGISRGEAIAAAAARIGLTEQTARNYSKRIYAKTATSGQADLTRVVLTGLAGLA